MAEGLPFEPFYQDSHCTIYNADCRKVLPWLERCDLLLTDPPYGIGASKMTLGKGQSDKAKKERFEKREWDADRPPGWVISAARERAAASVIWGGNYFADVLPPSNDWLVWHKLNDGRSFSECEFAWTSLGLQSRHFSWGWLHGGETKVHQTQKPLALMQWCLGLVPDAETVLDPFMGSGTTLVAAKLEGRKAIGIEINEKYCESAAERLRQGVLF